uniref:Reverse transcriptase n=1 Tax=Globodera rostochiensis TaxID=31243 RepID=A0A914ICB8_GLORO
MDELGFLEGTKIFLSGNHINQVARPNEATEIRVTIKGLRQKVQPVFKDGLGYCGKTKAHIVLKPDAKAVFRRARPVPYSALQIVNGELDRLEKMNIITPVEHTDWAAPILVVKKAKGAARLCADFSTGLNDILQLHQHPLPLPTDMFSALNRGKFFTVSSNYIGR